MKGTLAESSADALLVDLPDPATMRHVASLLEVAISTVSTWVSTGKLEARRIAGRADGIRLLIDRSALRAFLVAPPEAMKCPQCGYPDLVRKRCGDRELLCGDDDAIRPVTQSYECLRCDKKWYRKITVEWTKDHSA